MRGITSLLAAVTAAGLACVPGSPAQAVPDMGTGTVTFTFTIPDPASISLAMCTLTFTPTSSVTFVSSGVGVGTAVERGSVKITSTGCSSVTWTTTVTILDQAPGHETRTVTAAGIGNPASVTKTQSVGYALGQREAGLVTFTLAASSRLGNFCWTDTWQVTAFGNPSPIRTNPC